MAAPEAVTQHPAVVAQAKRLGIHAPPDTGTPDAAPSGDDLARVRARFAAAEDNYLDEKTLAQLRPVEGQAAARSRVDAQPENPRLSFDPNELGIADELIRRHSGKLLFDHSSGRWFAWDGSRYRPDEKARVNELVKAIIREVSGALKDGERAKLAKAATVAGIERHARSDPKAAVTADQLDANPMLLACPGVSVDLETGKTYPPRPDDLMTRCAGAAPKEGPHPIWTGFLMHATGGDEDMLCFLQILAGYVLTGQTVEHVLAFLFGPGGNGKSVFLNVLTRLMGDYAVTAPMDAFAAAQGERHSTELAMLAGARLVTASETQEGRAWDEARIKAVTGGDPITARFMRQDNFTFKPRFKLLISGNFQPVLRNVDPAMRRRLLMLPFTRTPARPDPDLEQKISGEAPAIMAWAIRGCLAWQDEGLPRPEAVTLATDTYFTDQDGFVEWFEASTVVGDAGSFAAAADLFASWKGFCEAAGERPGTAKTLGAKLRRRGLTNVARRIAGKPTKVWLGLSLRNGGVQ